MKMISFGAGVAWQNSNKNLNLKTVVLDGDGGFLMHLGSLALVSLSKIKKSNLIYVVLDNESYESTGSQPSLSLKVNFTIPYDFSGMSMVAHKVKAKGFSSLNDFNQKSVILAARMGTTAEQAARKYMPEAKLKLFENERLFVVTSGDSENPTFPEGACYSVTPFSDMVAECSYYGAFNCDGMVTV